MKSCPFCKSGSTAFQVDHSQGMKYGYVGCLDCFAHGPEVRTNYGFTDDAEWREMAEIAWDKRP